MSTSKSVRVAVLALSLGSTGAAAAETETKAAEAQDGAVVQATLPDSAPPASVQPGGPAPEDPAPPPAVPPLPGEETGDSLLDRLPIQFGGYFWVDTGYLSRINTAAGQWNQGVNYMQGRFALSATVERDFATHFFGRAKVDFLGLVNELAKSKYEAHTLDAYVMIGQKKTWDVQVGRFLAWEVYRRGQGIELWTAEEAGAKDAPRMYWLDVARGYRDQVGQAAVHYYPTDFLGFEVSTIYGQVQEDNNLGIRPVADLQLERLKVVVGAEFLQQRPQTGQSKGSETQWGYAGRVEYRFPIVTLGVNYARSTVDKFALDGIPDVIASREIENFGGYADIDFGPNSIGLGVHRTAELNLHEEFKSQDQAFASYLYKFPLKGLSAKAVFGLARANIQNMDAKTQYENWMRSVRLRLAYEFN